MIRQATTSCPVPTAPPGDSNKKKDNKREKCAFSFCNVPSTTWARVSPRLSHSVGNKDKHLLPQTKPIPWHLQTSLHQTALTATWGLKGHCSVPTAPQAALLPPVLKVSMVSSAFFFETAAATLEIPFPPRKGHQTHDPHHHFLLSQGNSKVKWQ